MPGGKLDIPRLWWHVQPHEEGLARIREAPRGWDLGWGDYLNLATVRPVHGPYRVAWGGWVWWSTGCAELGIPEHPVALSSMFESEKGAKLEALLYVKDILIANGHIPASRRREPTGRPPGRRKKVQRVVIEDE